MDEDVRPTRIRLYEAVAFVEIEELHRTSLRHG
jgi:hypothetical protein